MPTGQGHDTSDYAAFRACVAAPPCLISPTGDKPRGLLYRLEGANANPSLPRSPPMRKWLLAGLGVAIVGVAALLIAPSWLKARPLAKAQQEDGPKNAQLSIGQVVLF